MSRDFTKKIIFQSSLTFSLATLIIFLCTPLSFASTHVKKDYKNEIIPVCKNKVCDPFRLMASITGGAAFAKIGQSDTFYDDSSFYAYDSTSGTQTKALWGASVGEELRFFPEWSVQFDIAYYQISPYTASGTVTQGVDNPTAETFSYQYDVTSRQYLFETKILGDATSIIHPYLLLGVGASFNTVDGYSAYPGLTTFTPQFDNQTNISFSYAAGVGVDVDVANFARVGLGYRFMGLGTANLGDGMINTTFITNEFGQENLNAQEVVLQLTFLI